jgi:hypothetical protein
VTLSQRTEELVGTAASAQAGTKTGEAFPTGDGEERKDGECPREYADGDSSVCEAVRDDQESTSVWKRGVEATSIYGYFTRVPPAAHIDRRFLLPLGVTGNTSASGAEESRFDPWRGNKGKTDSRQGRLARDALRQLMRLASARTLTKWFAVQKGVASR